MGLSPETVEVLRASVPTLERVGVEITGRMYTNLLRDIPDLRGVFNMSHLRHVDDNNLGPESSLQAVSLAHSILAYAENADNLSALKGALETIAEKHCGFQVEPGQYAVVGKYLLESIRAQLGEEGATKQVMAAWKEAYEFLADVLIKREAELYEDKAKAKGGWQGSRAFVVFRREEECDGIASFYLRPKDNNSNAKFEFKPGQFVTVTIPSFCVCPFTSSVSEHPVRRSYSVSCSPGLGHLRISVRKEGAASSFLHESVAVGDVINLSPPCGSFALTPVDSPGDRRPMVFLSAGVGITPLMSMIESLLDEKDADGSDVTLVQCCRGAASHPMAGRAEELARTKGMRSFAFYSSDESDKAGPGLALTRVTRGRRLTADSLRDIVCPHKDAEFYFCGPRNFLFDVRKMLADMGVPEERRHYEFYGPTPFKA